MPHTTEPNIALKPSGKPLRRVPSLIPLAADQPVPVLTREAVLHLRMPPKPALLQPPFKPVPRYLSLNRARIPTSIKAYIGMGKEIDRSQEEIIKKINLYIDVANAYLKKLYPDPVEYAKHEKAKLADAGHCHGFNLYRAYLQDKGALQDYEDMLDIMINCPVDKLQLADYVFEIFRANILRGQYPREYFNAKYDQQNIAEILGKSAAYYHETEGEELTRDALEAKLLRLIGPYSRVILVGAVEGGCHTVSLSTDGVHGVDYFDPNSVTGAGLRVQSYKELKEKVWRSYFDNFGVAQQDKLKFLITVLHKDSKPQVEASESKLLSAAAHACLWQPSSPRAVSPDNMQQLLTMNAVPGK